MPSIILILTAICKLKILPGSKDMKKQWQRQIDGIASRPQRQTNSTPYFRPALGASLGLLCQRCMLSTAGLGWKGKVIAGHQAPGHAINRVQCPPFCCKLRWLEYNLRISRFCQVPCSHHLTDNASRTAPSFPHAGVAGCWDWPHADREAGQHAPAACASPHPVCV